MKDNKDREDTPAGYPVDEWGVSRDSDGDGVVDGADREIDTPEGADIDSFGVGKDGDGGMVCTTDWTANRRHLRVVGLTNGA